MDSTIQIQNLKSQLINMKLQLDNIETQNNNLMNSMIMPMIGNSIGEQLLNFSIQMMNTGVQAFNYGINMAMNDTSNYYEQLKNIAQQINYLVNSYDLQPEMNMPLPMMMSTNMMEPPMMGGSTMVFQEDISESQIQEEHFKINVIFEVSGKCVNMVIDNDTTIAQLLNKFTKERISHIKNKEIWFLFNGKQLNKDDTRRCDSVFNSPCPKIIVDLII